MSGFSIDVVGGSPPALQVRGDVDIANTEEFRTALEKALSGDSTLVVDLGRLTFIGAAGLRVIVQAAESRNGAGPLTLVNAPRVAQLLDIVGLGAIPTIEFVTEGAERVG